MDLKQTPPPPVSGDPQPRNPEPKFSTDRALNMAILVLGLVVAAYLVFIDDVFSFAFLVLAFTALMIISWCFDACAKSPERPRGCGRKWQSGRSSRRLQPCSCSCSPLLLLASLCRLRLYFMRSTWSRSVYPCFARPSVIVSARNEQQQQQQQQR
ncbi:hypothetical protein M6B38_377615 [Iris pallida]|uniref:Uncharacterized protein n=1 Tax=Iris pallida TaxID=29817 RepID=A0AAX6GAW8_IRIPA|nr:hypothetical protein M6B38_377615 [Iris pallida]